MPAANTGSESSSSTAVIITDHTNRGVWYCDIAGGFMLIIVVMKLMAPKIEETPAKCKEKMVRSTEAPAWARLPAKGGYTVQPVPAPASTIEDARSSRNEGGRSQKLILFIRGNAISGAPIIRGMRVRLQLRCRFGRLRAEFRVGLIQRELEGLELFLLYRPKHQIVDKGYQYLYGWLRIVSG